LPVSSIKLWFVYSSSIGILDFGWNAKSSEMICMRVFYFSLTILGIAPEYEVLLDMNLL
jgi:hypothetical protein